MEIKRALKIRWNVVVSPYYLTTIHFFLNCRPQVRILPGVPLFLQQLTPNSYVLNLLYRFLLSCTVLQPVTFSDINHVTNS